MRTQASAMQLKGCHTEYNLLLMCIAKHLKKRHYVLPDKKEYLYNKRKLHFWYKVFLQTLKFFHALTAVPRYCGSSHLLRTHENRSKLCINNKEE